MSLVRCCQVDSPEERGVHKERPLVVADTVYNELVLHAFRSANTATVQHARTGKVIRTLTCNESGKQILCYTPKAWDYFFHVSYFIFCKVGYMCTIWRRLQIGAVW
jgi:hypothetical protein